jgi:hypothetical protein
MSRRQLVCGRCGQLANGRELPTPPTGPTTTALSGGRSGPVFDDQLALFSIVKVPTE